MDALPEPAEMFAESVRRFGIDHTHDVTCRTWLPGQNWMGACDCTLDARTKSRASADAPA